VAAWGPVRFGTVTTTDERPPRLAGLVMRFDDGLGHAERVVIALTFLVLISVGFYRTFVDLAFNERPPWAIELIKVSVFAIAMLGAAYATHLKRNFSLDLVSRFLPPRGRAYLRIGINLLTAGAAGLLYWGGELVREGLKKGHESHEVVPVWLIGWFVPIAAILIIIHVLAHTVIEVGYLADGRIAPEPEQAVG